MLLYFGHNVAVGGECVPYCGAKKDKCFRRHRLDSLQACHMARYSVIHESYRHTCSIRAISTLNSQRTTCTHLPVVIMQTVWLKATGSCSHQAFCKEIHDTVGYDRFSRPSWTGN